MINQSYPRVCPESHGTGCEFILRTQRTGQGVRARYGLVVECSLCGGRLGTEMDGEELEIMDIPVHVVKIGDDGKTTLLTLSPDV